MSTASSHPATENAASETLHGRGAAPREGDLAVLRRGLKLAPEMTKGFGWTVVLALISTGGQIIVPMTVQHALDHGILAKGGVDLNVVWWTCALALLGVLVASVCTYLVNVRLFTASERGLASLRTMAFDHVHKLSLLTLNAGRRGSMVSRVTSDVDQISQFVQRGGMQLIVSTGQVVVASALMFWYSVPLAIFVWVCFFPLFFMLRYFQAMVGRAFAKVRERVADMLSAISEGLSGAATIRVFGIEGRTQRRIDKTIDDARDAAVGAQIRAVGAFVSGQGVSGVALTLVFIGGTYLGSRGDMTIGEISAFLFLTNLFTQPVQTATEVLNELQNALAGWRRVIEVLDTPVDVAEPAHPRELPSAELDLELDNVRFRYAPSLPDVIQDLSVSVPAGTRVAVVGETGSGKSTVAKLLTRLTDPTSGTIRLGGVNLVDIADADLRRAVAYLPQEGFLFTGTIADNVRFAAPALSDADVTKAFDAIGCGPWLARQPDGVRTQVGARGGALSAGEKQLVALARTYVTDPKVLILDEATSSVDPTTDVAVTRALEQLMAGRTSVIIAHRLATAEHADEIWVMDHGRLVERGTYAQLVAGSGIYARLHAGWVTSHSAGGENTAPGELAQ